MTCGLCGREFGYEDDHYNVMIQQAHGGVTEMMPVCEGCLARPLGDVLEAARRKQEAGKFEAQADREVKELTKDPDKCKEWIEAKDRYCTRSAFRHGYCKQHLWTHGIDAETGQKKSPVATDGAA